MTEADRIAALTRIVHDLSRRVCLLEKKEENRRIKERAAKRQADDLKMANLAHHVALFAANNGVSIQDLISGKRHQSLADIRKRAYASCLDAGFSSPRTGAFFNRDHSTVLHGAASARAGLPSGDE
jgi:chromosomal replication initiation ATPase DnaA